MGKRSAVVELFLGDMGSMQRELRPSTQREDQLTMETKLEQIAVKAVNQLPKSVVREIRTPRSVGTGSGRPPPVTRWDGKRSVAEWLKLPRPSSTLYQNGPAGQRGRRAPCIRQTPDQGSRSGRACPRAGRLLWTWRNRRVARRPGAGSDHASGPRRGKGSETLGCLRETRRDLLQLTAGQMQLAKNVIDLGLSTNNLEPMLRFWQQDAGLRFDHVLPVRRGQKQYRHNALGSVIKLNHHAEPLPAAAASGYRELIIAREGVEKPGSMVDPDGNRVRLVPPAHDGITQLAIRMGVRSLSEHRRF